MELLIGSTWQTAPVDSVVQTGTHLAEALAHLHEKGIVHRDIKPANIMICADRSVVLMDLGLARDFFTATTITAGNFPGTPAYMAPEQLAGHPATPASDVYGLGLVLIEKLTGKRGPAAQLSAPDRSTVAPHLLGLLDRMTALEPGDRPTAAECHALLREPAPAPTYAPGGTAQPGAAPVPAPAHPDGLPRATDRAALERFGPPALLSLIFALELVARDQPWSQDDIPFGLYLVILAATLLLTAVLMPHSGGLIRGTGYVTAVFTAIGTVSLSNFIDGLTAPTLFYLTAVLTVAAFCYREIKTRRVRAARQAAGPGIERNRGQMNS
ncbi:serine/threonine-protein kinase [Streptomyces sp. NPDC059009]|uniref:serine/threonine-protein kinase n=1 Tax=Streptomyces sp. NPDC059009 TaxID=3346694 RepID=UPI0036B7DCE8